MTDQKDRKQALVMLVELDDGRLSIIDADQRVREVETPEQLMGAAREILGSTHLPMLQSVPAEAPAREPAVQWNQALSTIGNRLRAAAEAEYGPQLVGAASVVANHASKHASGFLKKISRAGPRRRYRR